MGFALQIASSDNYLSYDENSMKKTWKINGVGLEIPVKKYFMDQAILKNYFSTLINRLTIFKNDFDEHKFRINCHFLASHFYA